MRNMSHEFHWLLLIVLAIFPSFYVTLGLDLFIFVSVFAHTHPGVFVILAFHRISINFLVQFTSFLQLLVIDFTINHPAVTFIFSITT